MSMSKFTRRAWFLMPIVWSIMCIGSGYMILASVFLPDAINKNAADTLSILMPLFFIVWFGFLYIGHKAIQTMFDLFHPEKEDE